MRPFLNILSIDNKLYMIYLFTCMAQFNINLTPEFEKDLSLYMKKSGVGKKSDALRQALHEAVERLKGQKKSTDFRRWRGLALKAPLNTKPRFQSEDDLWN